MAQGSITIDVSDTPLVWLSYVGKVTDAEFEAYLAEYLEVLNRGQHYGCIFDASRAGVPSALQRRLQADWQRRHERRLKQLCVGGAFVIRSAPIRGALTAILWLQPLPFPHSVVSTPLAALEWVCPLLQIDVTRRLADKARAG